MQFYDLLGYRSIQGISLQVAQLKQGLAKKDMLAAFGSFFLACKCHFELPLRDLTLFEEEISDAGHEPLRRGVHRGVLWCPIEVGFFPKEGKKSKVDSTIGTCPRVPRERALTLGTWDQWSVGSSLGRL